jgi:uncharacterized protein GlcG (DUF336 family)
MKATLSMVTGIIAAALLMLQPASAFAKACQGVPTWKQVKNALVEARNQDNGGLNLDMWATIVDRDGVVCSVTYTGKDKGSQWPGSRVISAQKANTANAFSLPGLSLSTANLYSAVQPGGSLFGLQHSNPVNTEAAYAGDSARYGQANDPMVGKRIGGVNVFGGGLALYNDKGEIIGALGVSGDTSCADHNIAWRARHSLNMDFVPKGVSTTNEDSIMYLGKNEAPNGFKQPNCGGSESKISLPQIQSKQAKQASSN